MGPADDKYIPSLDSQVEGENYFDPTTGFLYLLLRGTAPVDYRIQPSVVTKVGATIDMDNFFEGDVAGNIAALLGIDPANIRVTNIVREQKEEVGAFRPHLGHVGEHRLGDDHRAATQDKPQLHDHHGRRCCHGNWRPQNRNGRLIKWLPEWIDWRGAGHERDHDGDAGTDLRADARGLATPVSLARRGSSG